MQNCLWIVKIGVFLFFVLLVYRQFTVLVLINVHFVNLLLQDRHLGLLFEINEVLGQFPLILLQRDHPFD